MALFNLNLIAGIFPKNKSIEEKSKYFKGLTRSPEWIDAAIRKLKPTIENLTKLSGTKSEVVRLALANCVCSFIERCSR